MGERAVVMLPPGLGLEVGGCGCYGGGLGGRVMGCAVWRWWILFFWGLFGGILLGDFWRLLLGDFSGDPSLWGSLLGSSEGVVWGSPGDSGDSGGILLGLPHIYSTLLHTFQDWYLPLLAYKVSVLFLTGPGPMICIHININIYHCNFQP